MAAREPKVHKRGGAFSPNIFVLCARLWLTLGAAHSLHGQTTILHLKNGDRVAGTIVAEDTNRVLITTTWIKELAVPVIQIERRETVPAAAGVAAAPSAATTNVVVVARPGAAIPVTTVPFLHFSTNKNWEVEAKIGASFLSGATDSETYYGHFKLAHAIPYRSHTNEFFRNTLDYDADYGRTEGVQSANRMEGVDKTALDIGKRYYLYNLLGVGYDEVLKIDLRYEIGPGVGYHLFSHTNFLANAETGVDYQVQYRSDNTETKNFFPRVAEDVSWKLNSHFTFTERFEFFPPVATTEYRARLESNLSYALWANLSFNLSVLDLYDSHPAEEVPNNDLQVRSAIGITF
jgi:hypothetical protein